MLRTLVERAARGRTLWRSLMVSGRRIPILVSPDSQLKYMKPGRRALDLDLIRLAEEELTEQSVVWDIGANVGTFGLAAAAVATKGTVVLVEPDEWLVSLLRRSAAKQRVSHGTIYVLALAVGDTIGLKEFWIAKRGRASNSLASAGGRSPMGGIREKRLVPTLTLDALLEYLPPPSLLKLDIEGAEMQALRGAQTLLDAVRPHIYIEVGDATRAEIAALLESKAYRLDSSYPISESNLLFRPLAR